MFVECTKTQKRRGLVCWVARLRSREYARFVLGRCGMLHGLCMVMTFASVGSVKTCSTQMLAQRKKIWEARACSITVPTDSQSVIDHSQPVSVSCTRLANTCPNFSMNLGTSTSTSCLVVLTSFLFGRFSRPRSVSEVLRVSEWTIGVVTDECGCVSWKSVITRLLLAVVVAVAGLARDVFLSGVERKYWREVGGSSAWRMARG